MLNQVSQWQSVTSTNDRDDPTYATALPLASRSMQRLKDLIGKDGEVTTATNQVTLGPATAVKVGDLLDGREVVAIASMVSVAGATIGFRILTR